MTHRHYSTLGSLALMLMFSVSVMAQQQQPLPWQGSSYFEVPSNLAGYQEVGQGMQGSQSTTLARTVADTNGQTFQPDLTAAQSNQGSQARPHDDQGVGFTSSVEDPVYDLRRIRLMREQAKTPGDALFQTSPLTPLRERFIATEKRIFEDRDIKYGANLNTLFQGLTDNIDGTDGYGMAIVPADGWNMGWI